MKKLLVWIAVIMMTAMLPMMGIAQADEVYSITTMTYTPDVDLPDNDELFAMYAENVFYGDIYGGISTFSTGDFSARARLGTEWRKVYDALATEIRKIAAGKRSSAEIVVIADETGFSITLDEFKENCWSVVDALLADMPYEMYWRDSGMVITPTYYTDTEEVTQLSYRFKIAQAYRLNPNNPDDRYVNDKLTGATVAAVNVAKAVVEANEGKSDYEKLDAYRQYICDAVDYNHDAAGNSSTPYGDPWQMIYVFDKDHNTNVVCEGYAKAFQYLCDQTDWTGDVQCYSVAGNMYGATGGGGAHMWNIVTIGGKNYMADITNSDEGSSGADGSLFLTAPTSGDMTSAYFFGNVQFIYDSDTKSLWGTDSDSILKLADADYSTGDYVKYTVWHGYELLNEPGRFSGGSELMTGKVGTTTNVVAKDTPGFTAYPFEQITLKQEGPNEIQIFYDRNSYTLTIDPANGTGATATSHLYEADLSGVTLPTPTRAGYEFVGWDTALPATMPADNLTITAQWKKLSHTHALSDNGADLEWTGITSLDQIKASGNYYLMANVTSGTWKLSQYQVNLCLNGHKISAGIEIIPADSRNANTSLSVCDCQTSGVITGAIKNQTELNIYSGKVSVSKKDAITNAGELNVYGGTIACTNTAIKSTAGTVNITGGSITAQNNCIDLGGGTVSISGNPSFKLDSQFGTKMFNITAGTMSLSGGIYQDKISISSGTGTLKDILASGYTYYYADGTMVPAEELSKTTISGTVNVAPGEAQVAKYTVTFTDGQGKTLLTQQVAYDANIDEPVVEERVGYTFAGWKADNGEPFAGLFNYDQDMTFHAQWEPIQYWLQISGHNDESIVYSHIAYDTTIAAPVYTTEQEGHTFHGWYYVVDGEFGEKATFPFNMPAHDVTIEGKWTANEYSLTFLMEENGKVIQTSRVKYGEWTSEPTEWPQKTGYEFAGWTPNFFPDPMPAHDLTYVATWTPRTYTISFDTDGGDPMTDQWVAYNADVTLEDPTKLGCTFAGWVDTETNEACSTSFKMPAKSLNLKATWTANTYTITFNTNGGTEIAPITQAYGTEITVPANPTKEGHTFMMWECTKGTWPSIPTTMPAEDLEYTAHWMTENYSIWFEGVDGCHPPIMEINQPYGTAITKPADPTREGYTFLGWDKEIPATMPANELTITAKWTVNQYAITFNTDGGTTIAPIKQDYGTAIIAPADPTREGYTFAGWDPEIPATMPAGGITITAQWTAKQYTYRFVVDGEVVNSGTASYGEEIGKVDSPTKEHYSFENWKVNDKTADFPYAITGETEFVAVWKPIVYNVTISAGAPCKVYADPKSGIVGQEIVLTIDAGAGYQSAQVKINGKTYSVELDDAGKGTLKHVIDGDALVSEVELTPKNYTITFDTAGGTEIAPITQAYGTTITKPADPTKVGYIFTGWDKEIPATMPAGGMTITAQWKVNYYTITFVGTGDRNIEPIKAAYGDPITEPTGLTWKGHYFAGWMKGNQEYTFPATMPAENMELTALWTANQYSITFDTDGGTEIAPITQDYGTAITAPADPTKEGYTFAGWAPAIPATMPAEDMIITAQWKVNQYTIKFMMDENTEYKSIKQDYGTAITKPADPTWEGHTFNGWDKAIPATMPAEDMIITAIWDENVYGITVEESDHGTVKASAGQAKAHTEITLTITPDEGYVLDSLMVNDANVTSQVKNNSYTFTMPAQNVTVTAAFEAGEVSYTVETYIMETDSQYAEPVTETKTGKTGETITLTPEAKTGFTVSAEKSVLSAAIAGDGSTVLKVYYSRNLYAFKTIVDGVETSEDYFYEATIPAPADPTKEGYTFTGWDKEIPTTMPAENVTVTATFSQNHVCGSGALEQGQPAACDADGWKDYYKCSCGKAYEDEACTQPIADLEAWKTGAGKIPAGHTYGELIAATEAIHTQTELKGAVAAHYQCSACNEYFTVDKAQTTLEALTDAAPEHTYGEWVKTDPEYHWKECTCGLKANKDEHIYDNQSDADCNTCGYERKVEVPEYTVTVTTDGNGTAYADPASGIAHTDVTLIAIPNEGYVFKEWQVISGGVTVVSDQFTIGTADVEIKAVFEKIPEPVYTITVAADIANGTVTAPASAKAGETVTVTAAPNAGYYLEGWIFTDASGNPVAQTEENQFVMPASNVTVNAIFAPIEVSWTITVIADENGTARADHISAGAGEIITITATPNEGYELDAITAADAEGNAISVANNQFTMPASNVIVTVTFKEKIVEPVTYTVSFDANGGTGTMAPITVNEGACTLPACGFTAPEGRQFKAWQVGETEYQPDEEITVAADTTVIAVWEPIPVTTYTVSFDANDGTGTMTPVTVNDGASYTLPACGFTAPEGQQFKAWKVGETEYQPDAQITVAADTTVTAVWEAIPVTTYTVSFDANGGTGTMAPATVNEGAYTLPACGFTAPEGQRFKAWKVGETEYQPGEEITVAADTTVTAVWEPIPVTTYTVSFDSDGGTGTMAPVTANDGASFTLPECSFTAPEGQQFKAWKVGETEYQPDAQITVAADTTVIAVWEDIPVTTYTVSFDANGGTGTMAPVAVNEGAYTLPACGFTAPAGQQFKAWKVGETEYQPSAQITVAADTTVIAVWEDIPVTTYTVSFDANGGTGTMAPVTGVSGAYTLPACGFTAPEGQQFKAWKVGETEYQPSAQIIVAADTTVIAIWEVIPVTTYTVSFDANGGTGTMTPVTGVSGAYTLPACGFTAPAGQQFKAWKVGETEYQPDAQITVAADTTVTAVWEPIPVTTYTVSFDANDGTGTMTPVTGVSGAYTLPECTFTAPEGQQFKAWKVGETEYQPGAQITVAADTTVIAVWEPIPVTTYTVSFDANGGTGTMAPVTGVSGAYTLPECTFTAPAGQQFKAWKVGETEYQPSEEITVAADTTVIAVWEPIPVTTYTVSFDANGGTGTMAPATVNEGAYTLPACGFTAPEGQQFKAWKVGETEYQPGDQITVAADITVTAVWEEKAVEPVATYTLTFYPNGGVGTMAPQIFTAGIQQALTPNAFTRVGFTFNGWNTLPDGTGAAFADGQQVELLGDSELFAQWKAIDAPQPPADDPELPALVVISTTPNLENGVLSAIEGESALLSVAAYGGTGEYRYQWYELTANGSKLIPGAADAAYTIGTLQMADNGRKLYCRVTDTAGNTATSSIITLAVSESIEIPDTGDHSFIALWVTLSLLSAAGLMAMKRRGKG